MVIEGETVGDGKKNQARAGAGWAGARALEAWGWGPAVLMQNPGLAGGDLNEDGPLDTRIWMLDPQLVNCLGKLGDRFLSERCVT